MNADDLKEILRLHAQWLNGIDGGVRANLRGANLSGANLSEADLRGANLSRADLRGADLREADLRGADLREADLSRADLRGADLREADLSRADLREADLSRANLSEADLSGGDLSRADLREADLREADLSRANLSEADLSRADLREANVSVNGGLRVDYHAPDPSLPRRVAEHALVPGGLNMSAWHKCETTHCLAGWAIHLSGDLGRALEALTSPSVAGSILLPSASHLFFAGEAEALAWCQEQVASGVDAQGGGGAK